MDFFDEWLMQTDHPGLDASEPISDDEQRRIVRSHIVRITLEALFTAEYQIWAKSNQADLLKYSLETAHGKVDLNLPSALLKPWGSELIAADSGKLSFDPTKLLPLVVSDRSKKLKILSSIFTAKISDDFVALFDKASAQNLSRFEKALPKANWGSFHLGNLDFPEGGESRGLSYCIGIDAKNRPHVLGLWDSPDQSGPQWSKVSARLAELGIEQDRTHETEADSDGPDLNNDPTAEAEASDDPLIKSVEVRSHIPLDIAELRSSAVNPAMRALRSLATATPAIILLSLAVFYGLDRYSPADLLKLVPAHRFNLFAAFSKQSPPALLEKIEKAADRSLLDATGILIDLSQHSDYEVKIAAAKALARPFHASIPASENALTKLLDDSDFLVRGFAARSLAKIGTSTAISAIKRRAQRENDAAVRKLLQKLSV